VTADADIRRIIHDLPFAPQGPTPYLNEADMQLMGEVISLEKAVGTPLNITRLRTKVVDVVRGREENAEKHVTCNRKYMKKLLKKMRERNLVSAHRPSAVSRSRAKQRDPGLAIELSAELKKVWSTHKAEGLLEDEHPRPQQIFNMDEIG
jgi:hypothetical protein